MVLVKYFFDLTIKKLNKSSSISDIVVISNNDNLKDTISNDKLTFLTDRNEGVNNAILIADSYLDGKDVDGSIVIPIDLPLMTSKDIDHLCEISTEFSKCVMICPSKRFDGTNILFRKPHNIIKTHYDNNSYRNHLLEAKRGNIFIKDLYHNNLVFDIDTKEDLFSLTKIGNWRDILKEIGIYH